jgi:hypothetical protein
MDGERHVARNYETADKARDHGHENPCDQGVLGERVAEHVE